MADALGRALELVARYDREVQALLPPEAEIFDAHLHLGRDIDGMVGDYDQLEALMSQYGVAHAFMFCLDEPDRHPAFRAANNRTLEFAARSGRRLVPFVRLDLNESPLEEAERCLDLGARGIKLHPRAQRFEATDARLAPVFALAAERAEPTSPVGGAATLAQPMQLARIHQYISMCTPLLWTRQPDTLGMLGLAINTCAERDGHAEAIDRIRELLEAARELWETWADLRTEAERFQAGRLTARLVHLADIEAVTIAA